MSAGQHTVHVRVNDAATGQPTPVRIRFTTPDGAYFAPFGRLAKFAVGRYRDVGGSVLLGSMLLGDRRYAYIDGTCEVSLPAGPLVVEISKGPEYRAARHELSLGAGKIALRLTIERWTNLREQGWYSGDTNALLPMPHAALFEAAAEDVAVANLLATQARIPRGKRRRSYAAIPNMLAFSGQRPALEMPGHMVVVNTQNYHRVLGSLGLLNCHRAVYPLVFGRPRGMDNWTLSDWCDQCHRKGGLVVWTRRSAQVPEDITFLASEALADFVLGKVDAFEVAGVAWCSFENPEWYHLLNSGLRVTFVGASNKDSNLSTLGDTRTYAHLASGEPLTYAHWIEAIRAGRTFVTNGPLLSFTVNGQEPGATVTVSQPGQTARIRAEAQCVEEFDGVEVVLNGKIIASEAPTGSPYRAVIELDWPMQASGWLAARCWGTREMRLLLSGAQPGAHTSPVYVRVADQPMRPDSGAISRLLGGLDYMLQWLEQSARFENDRQRDHLRGIFLAAKSELARRRAVCA